MRSRRAVKTLAYDPLIRGKSRYYPVS